MKKIIFAIAIVLTMTFSANAQSDNFVTTDYGNTVNRTDDPLMPFLPIWGVGAYNNDQSALPLGNGLLVLTALGAGYALKRVKNRDKVAEL